MFDSLKPPRGTILVVDNARKVRSTLVAILVRANYRVLSACTAKKAIEIASETDERIDLLISGVQMDRMSGLALGEILRSARPHIRVVLVAEGSDGDLLVLNHGWMLLQKAALSRILVQLVANILYAAKRDLAAPTRFASANIDVLTSNEGPMLTRAAGSGQSQSVATD